MITAVISDCHVHNFRPFGGVKVSGVNERCNHALAAIARAVEIANTAEADRLVVTGDLFDVSDPPPQVIASTIEVFQQFTGDVFLLVGNHDQYSLAEGDHAFGPMHKHRTGNGTWSICAVESPKEIAYNALALPFNPAPVSEWLPAVLADRSAPIVYAHFGIIDAGTPSFLRNSSDAIAADELFALMKKHEIERFVVGNWHEHHRWRLGYKEIIQVGALTPTGFNNLGTRYGRVVLIGEDLKVSVHEVPGPRFHKAKWGAKVPLGELVYVHVDAEPADLVVARAWLKEQREAGKLAGFSLVPNKARANEQARKAAKATAQISAIAAASAAFIQKMPLEEGVSRKKVLARVQKYLGGKNDG